MEMPRWLRKIRVSEADKAELLTMKMETEQQAVEARGLLADARRTAERVRRARDRDTYNASLDQIFGGDK
jgi:hypothetical protein